MNIHSVVFISIVACVIILLLKNHNPSIGFILSISLSALLFVMIFPKFNTIIHTLENISKKAGIDSTLFEVLIKCLGISYLTEWGMDICKDAGQNALCTKVELFGRIAVIVVVLPIVEQILNSVVSIIK